MFLSKKCSGGGVAGAACAWALTKALFFQENVKVTAPLSTNHCNRSAEPVWGQGKDTACITTEFLIDFKQQKAGTREEGEGG